MRVFVQVGRTPQAPVCSLRLCLRKNTKPRGIVAHPAPIDGALGESNAGLASSPITDKLTEIECPCASCQMLTGRWQC